MKYKNAAQKNKNISDADVHLNAFNAGILLWMLENCRQSTAGKLQTFSAAVYQCYSRSHSHTARLTQSYDEVVANCNEVVAHINEVIWHFNEVRAHNDEVIRLLLMLKLISYTYTH